MREKIKLLVAVDLVFLLLLMLSGAFSGALSTVIYILAFVIPFAIAVFSSKMSIRTRSAILPLKNADIVAAGIFPTVISVMLISSVTAEIMGLFGKSQTVELGDSIVIALLLHALVPALFEEALFRYIPLRLLAGENGVACVLISALLFALSHHSLFSIPYAFVAGVAFMTLDIISGSVIPSLVIHLLNNTVSVLLMFYSDNMLFVSLAPIVITILACVSLVYLVVIRERCRAVCAGSIERKEKYKFSYDILLFVIPTLIMSASELLT